MQIIQITLSITVIWYEFYMIEYTDRMRHFELNKRHELRKIVLNGIRSVATSNAIGTYSIDHCHHNFDVSNLLFTPLVRQFRISIYTNSVFMRKNCFFFARMQPFERGSYEF